MFGVQWTYLLVFFGTGNVQLSSLNTLTYSRTQAQTAEVLGFKGLKGTRPVSQRLVESVLHGEPIVPAVGAMVAATDKPARKRRAKVFIMSLMGKSGRF